jgi:hypothetical protein
LFNEGEAAMADTIEDALDQLAERGRTVLAELPPRLHGTVRLEVADQRQSSQWFVRLEKGKIQISPTGPPPDATISGERTYFDRLARGEDRFIPLLFRNALVVEGDLGMADQLSRVLFAGAPTGQHPRDFAGKGGADHEREDGQHPGREHVRRH